MPPGQVLTKPTPFGAQGVMLWTLGKLRWGGTCFISLNPYFCPIPIKTVVLKDFLKPVCVRAVLCVSEDVTVSLRLHAGALRRVRLHLCGFCEHQLLFWELVMAGVGARRCRRQLFLVHTKRKRRSLLWSCSGHGLLPLRYGGSAPSLLLLPPLQLCWHHSWHYVMFIGPHTDPSPWSMLN